MASNLSPALQYNFGQIIAIIVYLFLAYAQLSNRNYAGCQNTISKTPILE